MAKKQLHPANVYTYTIDNIFYTVTGSPETGYMVMETHLYPDNTDRGGFVTQNLWVDEKDEDNITLVFETLVLAERAILGKYPHYGTVSLRNY